MSLVFYDCATAPSPRRARIILAEKKVPHDVVQVDLRTGEQLDADYLKVNPHATVPALQVNDNLVIADNAGIAAYLEAEYPDPPLLGETSEEKAQIASWNAKIEFDCLHAVMEALRNATPAMKDRALPGVHDYQQIPELAERGLRRIGHFFDAMDKHLEGKEFIAAERFSVADISAVVGIDFARIVRLQPQEHHANILRWRAAMAERPSINM